MLLLLSFSGFSVCTIIFVEERWIGNWTSDDVGKFRRVYLPTVCNWTWYSH